MSLQAPSDGTYATFSECFEAIQSHAANHGYAVRSIPKNKNKAGAYVRHLVICDKAGTFVSKAKLKVKTTTTKRTNCPFAAVANVRPQGHCDFKVINPQHNHPASSSISDHIQHRKLTDDHRRCIENGVIAHKTSRAIWQEIIAANVRCPLKLDDIKNYIKKYKKSLRPKE